MAVSLKIDPRRLDDRLRKMINAHSNPSKLLRSIKPVVEDDQKKHFALKRGPDSAWKRLTRRYLEQKLKTNSAADILVASGKLRRQSTKATISKFAIEIVPTVEYAAVHQFGFRPKNIPARPFLFMSKRANQKIFKLARKFFFKGI